MEMLAVQSLMFMGWKIKYEKEEEKENVDMKMENMLAWKKKRISCF